MGKNYKKNKYFLNYFLIFLGKTATRRNLSVDDILSIYFFLLEKTFKVRILFHKKLYFVANIQTKNGTSKRNSVKRC